MLVLQSVLVVLVLDAAVCSPFLYGVPRALTTLAGSASASASSPSEQLSNIADLRRKELKAELLQPEKRLVENQEVEDDGVDFDGVINDDSNNEASPSLLQKKVNKILNKFRLISSLSNAIHGTGGSADRPAAMDQDNLEKDLMFFEKELETDDDRSDDVAADSAVAQQQTLQKVIYPANSYGEPLRVTLEIREAPGGSENGTTDEDNNLNKEGSVDGMEQEMGKLAQIGVFFAELFGSLVGLAYGAAAHFNNSSQATTTAVPV